MLFRKNVAKFCSYCKHAGQTDHDQMLCTKKGFVSPDGKCWRFRYDPLKRVPRRKPDALDELKDLEFAEI